MKKINPLSLSGASSEPIISAESKKNQPRYSVNYCAIPEYDRFGFGFAQVLALGFLLSLNLSESWAVTCNFTPDPNNEGKYMVRRLIPLETWRLMGCTDEDFHKASQLVSNTSLYKQAGNSIVVNVLEAIFRNLFLVRD